MTTKPPETIEEIPPGTEFVRFGEAFVRLEGARDHCGQVPTMAKASGEKLWMTADKEDFEIIGKEFPILNPRKD